MRDAEHASTALHHAAIARAAHPALLQRQSGRHVLGNENRTESRRCAAGSRLRHATRGPSSPALGACWIRAVGSMTPSFRRRNVGRRGPRPWLSVPDADRLAGRATIRSRAGQFRCVALQLHDARSPTRLPLASGSFASCGRAGSTRAATGACFATAAAAGSSKSRRRTAARRPSARPCREKNGRADDRAEPCSAPVNDRDRSRRPRRWRLRRDALADALDQWPTRSRWAFCGADEVDAQDLGSGARTIPSREQQPRIAAIWKQRRACCAYPHAARPCRAPRELATPRTAAGG